MGAELARKRAGKKTRTGMSEGKLSEFASKSMDTIDAYLFKHDHILPCGHHAEEGSDIDKACSVAGCDVVSAPPAASPAVESNAYMPPPASTAAPTYTAPGLNTSQGGNVVTSSTGETAGTASFQGGMNFNQYLKPPTPTGQNKVTSGGATASWGGGTTGGMRFTMSRKSIDSSEDSIKLINRYLDKQSRSKCKHKKGDPNHLEAA